MKNRASAFLKQILAVLSAVVKAKSLAAKTTKTSAIKTRFLIFSLMKNKKLLMGSISNKIHNLLAHQDKQLLEQGSTANDQGGEGQSTDKAIVLYNNSSSKAARRMQMQQQQQQAMMMITDSEEAAGSYYDDNYDDDDDDKYPDLTHTLFESDCEDLDDQSGSVIDLVKNSKERDEGKDFSLEDEIDHVADLFIRRFHRQIRMQKQESFNRYQEMLERSV